MINKLSKKRQISKYCVMGKFNWEMSFSFYKAYARLLRGEGGMGLGQLNDNYVIDGIQSGGAEWVRLSAECWLTDCKDEDVVVVVDDWMWVLGWVCV